MSAGNINLGLMLDFEQFAWFWSESDYRVRLGKGNN